MFFRSKFGKITLVCLDVPVDLKVQIMCREWVDQVISGFHHLGLYSQFLENQDCRFSVDVSFYLCAA
jgi:hypothetical protein